MTNTLLKGVRVLDLSRLLPGPFCSLYLAQLGAEVVKIEEPGIGDYARNLSPELFKLVNRGKKSVTLDLRQPEAVAQFKEMVKSADVVLESFRPGVMDKLGCGYETLRAINPKLIYASLTGYGQTGPYRLWAGHDMNYLSIAGVMDQLGEAGGPPVQSNVQIADLAGGALTCAIGVLAGVIGAQRSGQGCLVDSSMSDGSLALQAVALASLRTSGKTQPRGEDMLTGVLPNYRMYRCRDRRYLAVGALEPKFFKALLEGLWQTSPSALQQAIKPLLKLRKQKPRKQGGERPASGGSDPVRQLTEMLDNPRKRALVLKPVSWALAGVFRLKSRDEWARLLAPYDACITPVLTLEEALQNEHNQARGLIETLGHGPAIRNPLQFVNAETSSGMPPELGQHNAELLATQVRRTVNKNARKAAARTQYKR